MDIKLFDSELKVMDVLWKQGDTPAREIARVLDMTVSAVERTVSRAKARLREALEGLGVEV